MNWKRHAVAIPVGLRRLWLVCMLAVGLVACSDAPEARYEKLKAAIEDDDFETFTSFFTLESSATIRDMMANGQRSKIHYIKDWKTLVPVGDVAEVEIVGQVAFLKVGEGKRAEEIRMLLEHDEWCVDLEGLTAYWQPLKGEQ
jgi:hypothetical protein